MKTRPRKKKTRHGATQPEYERLRKQVLLRLQPACIDLLDDLADNLDVTKSDVVEQALTFFKVWHMAPFAPASPEIKRDP